MAIADTVYYEDQDVRITGKDLVLYKRPYWVAKVQSTEIVAMQVLETPLPAWAVRILAGSRILIVGVFLGSVALAVTNTISAFDAQHKIIGPFILLNWTLVLISTIIAFYRRREVVQVPVLRFRRSRWAASDLKLASMDRAYLGGIAAVTEQVLHGQDPAPLAITPPAVYVAAPTVSIGDHVYALADIESVSYRETSDKYTFYGSLIGSGLWVMIALSWIIQWNFNSVFFGVYLAFVGLSVLYLMVSATITSVYVLVLKGSFGTAYPFACADSFTIRRLVEVIKTEQATQHQPLQSLPIRPNQ